MTQIKSQKQQSGFALLMTILVLSVIVTVTLSMVELTMKQLKLSVDSKDSEIAFHAANAGMECANYTRRLESDKFETGTPVNFNCFGSLTNNVAKIALGIVTTPTFPIPVASGQVNRYRHNIDWGTASDLRCTTMDIITIVASTSEIVIGSASDSLINKIGYESDSKTCSAGERCTIISVAGYSSTCANIANSGVLKREILLEL